jgi:hypothetical protein
LGRTFGVYPVSDTGRYVPLVFGAFSSEPLNLFSLAILFSEGISLSNEESGTHLNKKNLFVEVMSLFYGGGDGI